jgi:hypothetical protein
MRALLNAWALPHARESSKTFFIAAILSLTFALGYVAWRGVDYIVWDDTSSASFNRFVGTHPSAFKKPGWLSFLIEDCFGAIAGDGYRPISKMIRVYGSSWVMHDDWDCVPFVLVNGLLLGCCVVAFVAVARRFCATRLGIVLAALLFFFSTPILTGLLVVFSGIQVLVPLLILLSLICYFRALETTSKTARFLSVSGIAATFLVGPWVREFIGISPFLILVLEFQRKRCMSLVSVMAAVFAFHAVFPTALLHVLFFPDLPIRPVFMFGNLGHYLLAGQAGGFSIANLHWRIFLDALAIVPPSIYVLAAIDVVAAIAISSAGPFDADRRFLAIFFLASFLPFLKIFNEQVHLAYALLPLSLLLAGSVERVWALSSRGPWVRAATALAIAVIAGDQALNLYSVRKTTDHIYRQIRDIARMFQKEVPRNAIVLGNALHLEDIRFYSNGHIDPWALMGGCGIPDSSHWLTTDEAIASWLSQNSDRPIYLLDLRIPERHLQRGPGRFNYFTNKKVIDLEYLGKVGQVHVNYPFLDPLRYLLPIQITNWTGPPDLEFDFYRGPTMHGAPFRKQVVAEYHLYLVQGRSLARWPDPVLIEQDFHGYNLVGYQNRVYGIRQNCGPFDPERIKDGVYPGAFVADDAAQIKPAILQRQQGREKQADPRDVSRR